MSLNSSDINEENKSQSFENEKITEINRSFKKTPNRVDKAFSWESYSQNISVTNNDESQHQKVNPHVSQNDGSSMSDDTIKVKILSVL